MLKGFKVLAVVTYGVDLHSGLDVLDDHEVFVTRCSTTVLTSSIVFIFSTVSRF